jgi:hypothetical protein
MRNRVGVALALAVLTAFAFFLRFDGHGFRLPHAPEPDSVVLYTQVRAIEQGTLHPERDPIFGFYPTFVSRCVTWFSEPRVASGDGSLDDDLAQASDVHRRGRTAVALVSTLSVVATFLLARAFFSTGWSLLAALFVATSVLNLWFAQQFRPHAAAASFALLAVLTSLRVVRHGRARDYVACGIALALGIATLQSGIALLLPFAAALIVRRTTSRDVSIVWTLVALALVAVSMRIFYPFMFAGSAGADAADLAIEGSDLNVSGHVVMLRLFNGGGFRKVAEALIGYEPWLSVLGVIGAGLILHCWLTTKPQLDSARKGEIVVILAHAVPYLIAIGMYQRTYQRFVLPLLPYLACLAAYAILRAAKGRSRIVTAVLVLVLAGPQVAAALRMVVLRNAPDTGSRAADWVREHATKGERVFVLPSIDLPLRRSKDALAALPAEYGSRISPWLDAQVAGELSSAPRETFDLRTMPIPADDSRAEIMKDPEQYARSLDADFAVIEVYLPEHRAVLAAIRDGLAKTGQLATRIEPDGVAPSSSMPLGYQDDELPQRVPWAWRAMRARGYGPVIEIYDLR